MLRAQLRRTNWNGCHLTSAAPSRRSWVMRRRHSIRSLSVAFPGNESLEGNLCLMPLICALAATLAETGLQRLRYTFTCEVPWMDALVPLGPSPLRELTICDCHLPELPQALTTLPCLTSLEIGVCQGFAEHLGGVEGMGELSRLTNLRSLALHHAAFGAGGHARCRPAQEAAMAHMCRRRLAGVSRGRYCVGR